MERLFNRIANTRREGILNTFSGQTEHKANLFCAVSMLLIVIALSVHLALVAAGMLGYSYSKVELWFIHAAMAVYVLSVLVAGAKRFRKPACKHLLVGGLILGGALMFAVLGRDGGVFILFPMFAAGLYYSEQICVRTYIHLALICIADMFVFFRLDINYIHYYGLTWNMETLILNYIIPELVYLTVVFLFSLYTMKSGRKLLNALVMDAEESSRKKAELETCAELQRSALPAQPGLRPEDGFTAAAGLRSAYETAGDYYDLFKTGKNRLTALIADVSDKGLASALYMMSARNTVRSLFSCLEDPEEVLTRTNTVLCETSDREFVTMFLLCVDTETGEGRFINAGHNPPVIVHADGSFAMVETEPQPIMGAFEDTRYKSSPIGLESGDILCMYTDGITDSLNAKKESYGLDRMISLIRKNRNASAEELKEAILKDVDSFADRNEFIDDRTVVILKRA